MIVWSRELPWALVSGRQPAGLPLAAQTQAEQPECRVFVYPGMFPSPLSLGCQAAPCFSARVLWLMGPPLRPCSAEGFSGLLRIAGVSPPIDGEVDAQEGVGHHTPPLVNESWIRILVCPAGGGGVGAVCLSPCIIRGCVGDLVACG